MPAMSTLERAFCRSRLWRLLTHQIVPWALAGVELHGQVLELGSGAGSAAAELLTRFPSIRVTATDVDPSLLETARQRLDPFGDRATVQHADATALPFSDGSFDAVISLIMLHHTVHWEDALSEATRVLKPGGRLLGYDVIESHPARLLHRFDLSPHRLTTPEALSRRLRELPMEDVQVEPALRGLIVRFQARRSALADTTDRQPRTHHGERP